MNRKEEWELRLGEGATGHSWDRLAWLNDRRKANKDIIRVLKRITNQKQPRFYEPPAIRHEESIIGEGFSGFLKWEREGKPTRVWYHYPKDIFEWIHIEKGMRSPVFDYEKWLITINKNEIKAYY